MRDNEFVCRGMRPSAWMGCGSQKIAAEESLSEKHGIWLWRRGLKIQALAKQVEADEPRQQDSLDAIQRAADPEWDRKRAAEAARRRAVAKRKHE